jgi:hypothetical protein
LRAQIFMLPKIAFDPPANLSDPFITADIRGYIINCETDGYLLTALEVLANAGHYADVIMLKDGEPWPTIEDRRARYCATDSDDSSSTDSGVPAVL